MKDVGPFGQFAKAFVVGATQFPLTVYAAAASPFTGGQSWKDYTEKGIKEAGLGISSAAAKGHATGD